MEGKWSLWRENGGNQWREKSMCKVYRGENNYSEINIKETNDVIIDIMMPIFCVGLGHSLMI